jgi:hypothetical protein
MQKTLGYSAFCMGGDGSIHTHHLYNREDLEKSVPTTLKSLKTHYSMRSSMGRKPLYKRREFLRENFSGKNFQSEHPFSPHIFLHLYLCYGSIFFNENSTVGFSAIFSTSLSFVRIFRNILKIFNFSCLFPFLTHSHRYRSMEQQQNSKLQSRTTKKHQSLLSIIDSAPILIQHGSQTFHPSSSTPSSLQNSLISNLPFIFVMIFRIQLYSSPISTKKIQRKVPLFEELLNFWSLFFLHLLAFIILLITLTMLWNTLKNYLILLKTTYYFSSISEIASAVEKLLKKELLNTDWNSTLTTSPQNLPHTLICFGAVEMTVQTTNMFLVKISFIPALLCIKGGTQPFMSMTLQSQMDIGTEHSLECQYPLPFTMQTIISLMVLKGVHECYWVCGNSFHIATLLSNHVTKRIFTYLFS